MAKAKVATAVIEFTTDTSKVPPGFDAIQREAQKSARSLEAAARQMSRGITDISTTAKQAAVALAGMVAVGTLVAAGKGVLDYAGNVADLSAKLGVSTTAVQQWKAAFGPAGVELDTVAKSASILSEKIAGGDKSATAVLKALGLSISDLRKLKPEQQFNIVADAVGKLTNQGERVIAAKTLFGKGGVDMLAALDGQLQSNLKTFDRLGIILDEQTIKAADDFGDQIGLLGQQVQGLVAQALLPLLPKLSELLAQVQDLVRWFTELPESTRLTAVAIVGITAAAGPAVIALLKMVDAAKALGGGLRTLSTITIGGPSSVLGLLANPAVLATVAALGGAAVAIYNFNRQLEAMKNPSQGKPLEGLEDSAGNVRLTLDQAAAKLREMGVDVDHIGPKFEVVEGHTVGIKEALDESKVSADKLKAEAKAIAALMADIRALQREDFGGIGSYRVGDDATLREMRGNVRGFLDDLDKVSDKTDDIDKLRAKFKELGDIIRVTMLTVRGTQIRVTTGLTADEVKQWVNLDATTTRFAAATLPAAQRGISQVKSTIDPMRSALDGVENVLGGINTQWANMAVVAARTIDGIVSSLQKGDWIGAISAGVAGGVQLLGNLFRDEQWEEVNDLRDAFMKAAGGLAALNQRAVEATGSLSLVQAVLDARTVDDYEAAIARLNDALERRADLEQRASQFGPTQTQLREAVADAAEVLDYMEQQFRAGEVTQDQVNQAYYAWQKAMADAGNEAAKTWVKAHDAAASATSDAKRLLDELTKQRDGLLESVANEAPEEVMGVIEAQTRGQIAALDKQIEAQRQAMEEGGREGGEASVAAFDRAIRDWTPPEVTIRARLQVDDSAISGFMATSGLQVESMAHGGFGRATGPRLFYTRGNEDYAFSGEGKSFGAGFGRVPDRPYEIKIGQRALARGMMPFLREAAADTKVIY